MNSKDGKTNKSTWDINNVIKSIHCVTFPAVDGLGTAIGEMIVAIRDISIKYKLDTYTIVKIIPELTTAFLKGAEINPDCEWKM
jgi:hypothetical protein